MRFVSQSSLYFPVDWSRQAPLSMGFSKQEGAQIRVRCAALEMAGGAPHPLLLHKQLVLGLFLLGAEQKQNLGTEVLGLGFGSSAP